MRSKKEQKIEVWRSLLLRFLTRFTASPFHFPVQVVSIRAVYFSEAHYFFINRVNSDWSFLKHDIGCLVVQIKSGIAHKVRASATMHAVGKCNDEYAN